MVKVRAVAACALGGSISFICDRLIESARKFGLDLQIESVSVDKLRRLELAPYDLVFVAPHVKFHLAAIREHAGSKPVVVIDPSVYATLDADRLIRESVLRYVSIPEGGRGNDPREETKHS